MKFKNLWHILIYGKLQRTWMRYRIIHQKLNKKILIVSSAFNNIPSLCDKDTARSCWLVTILFLLHDWSSRCQPAKKNSVHLLSSSAASLLSFCQKWEFLLWLCSKILSKIGAVPLRESNDKFSHLVSLNILNVRFHIFICFRKSRSDLEWTPCSNWQ